MNQWDTADAEIKVPSVENPDLAICFNVLALNPVVDAQIHTQTHTDTHTDTHTHTHTHTHTQTHTHE